MSTYSPSLRIELITTGDQAGTWGVTTNTNLGTLIESAVAGYTSVSITSANQALTALNGVADQSRNMTIALTTTTTAAFNVYAPPAEKTYVIQNASAYTATIYNSSVLGNTTPAGTGVAVPAGRTVTIWSDGTNFAFQNDHLNRLTLATALAVTDGGTGSSTASGARTNLGLGTIATQNSNAVSITGGSITGITDLAIADGGTGASTTADARTNLDVPSRSGGGASGTWSINVSGNAGTATAPASGGSFITSSNIGSQSVAFATNATNATNSTFASNPASGGSFITSSNIGGQSVAYATNAGTAASVSSIADAQICKAWARIDINGNLVAGYNISSTSGTVPCTVNLASAVADTAYAPVISGLGSSASTRYACIGAINSSSQFTVFNGSALTGLTGVAIFR